MLETDESLSPNLHRVVKMTNYSLTGAVGILMTICKKTAT